MRRAFIFVPSALKNSVGNGKVVHIRPALVWRLSCSGLVKGDSRGCAAVSGVIAGARRPDDAWRKWNVDGGDWPGCRLSGAGKMACRAGLRRDVAVFLCAMLADLATHFVTPQSSFGVAFPDYAGATENSL